jgi:PAS domain S-box-containing protein
VDQLIDHPFLVESEVPQGFAFSQNALDLAGERGLAYGLAASTGISKDYWHLIFDTIPCGVVLINIDMQVVEANRAAERILGVDSASMQQYLFASDGVVFRRPDGTPLPYEELQVATVFRTRQAQSRVLEGFVRPDGQLCWIEIDAAPVCETDGTITHAVITFVDVTER